VSKVLRAPFPWFGGKSRAAALVWQALGDVSNYVEPFAGSLAILLGRPHEPRIETVNDLDCVAPVTRLLRSDMSWSRAGDVNVGDELLAFDEENGLRAPERYRRFARSVVTAVRRIVKPSYRLTFDDGTSVVASADHLWLAGSHASGGRGWRWVRTESMVCGRATQRSWVLKICDVVEREESFDAGWISGLFDGEGSLVVGPGLRASLAQNEGPVLERAERLLRERGITATITGPQRCKRLVVTGGKHEQLALLMRFRPLRLVKKLLESCGEVGLYGRAHRAVGLVSKEFLGEQEVMAIETSSRTFVAEGLASHNCHVANFWRAVAADPEAVAVHTDWPVNEADLNARHSWLVAQEAFRERMHSDPDFFDARIAGWWVWGLSCWIGGRWCDTGTGVNCRRLPGGSSGQGVQRPTVTREEDGLVEWFFALAKRLRRVRVCCGDWSRVITPAVLNNHGGATGVVLDPPYDQRERTGNIYAQDTDVSAAVRAWAVEHGADPGLRIVLCGYEGEHEMPPSWRVVEWSALGGYARSERGRANRHRERLWLSPACLTGTQGTLFGSAS